MSSAPYEKALAKKAQLEIELQKVQTFLDMYAEFAGDDQPQPPTEAASPNNSAESSFLPITPYEELENIAIDVLIKNGRPLKRQQFYDAVKATGAIIGGNDERGNFGSKMSRSSRLINIEGHGYWPKDKACPSAGYFPATTDDGGNLFP